MSQLFIDIGNSCLHWSSKAPGQPLSAMQSCPYRDQELASVLSSHWSTLESPEKIMICSVASEEVNNSVGHWLQKHFEIAPRFVESQAAACGIQNGYREPARLGSDRWAAMIAAFELSQAACCVLDCGTATTFDVVNPNGQHLGGWIAPGYALFQSSLSQKTAAIGLSDEPATTNASLGNSTQECVDVAWHQGMVGLVQRTLQVAGLAPINCFVTGGDASRLLPLLGDEWCYANDLVLQGLAVMASQD
jgi:type III pantothenate kinase